MGSGFNEILWSGNNGPSLQTPFVIEVSRLAVSFLLFDDWIHDLVIPYQRPDQGPAVIKLSWYKYTSKFAQSYASLKLP